MKKLLHLPSTLSPAFSFILSLTLMSCLSACSMSQAQSSMHPPLMSVDNAPSDAAASTPPGNTPFDAAAALMPEKDAAPDQLTLLMVGDILLHTPIEDNALHPDGTYHFDTIFAHTREAIQNADLAFVNQEVIIGGEELGISGYPAFNAPYAIGDALADAGFDVICHATNHAMDKGKRGILNCVSYWGENHPEIAVVGIHNAAASNETAIPGTAASASSTAAFANGITAPNTTAPSDATDSNADHYFVPGTYICLYTKNDITVAILNYTYGTNGIPLPAEMPYAVDLLEDERVIADIRTAEELADFTVVCPHWGTEYRLTADSMQEKWTQLFLENGVDLVLGTHPHVIEPITWVENPDTGHKMLVYYSLGNFVNWTSGTGAGVSNRMVGGMAEVTLSRGKDDTVVISDYGVEAVVCHVEEKTDGITVYPLSEYTAELSGQNAIRSQAPDFSLDYCIGLCNDVWGELWK